MSDKTTRVGVDVGGTFTDLVLHDGARGLVHTGKLLTTHHDPSEAILNGIQRILDEVGLQPQDLHSIVHGTTLVTNTVIERTGARLGLMATTGFRDVIEIGRETRYDLYDLFLETPQPLVPRALRLEVGGRLDAFGREIVPLDEDAVRSVASRLVEEEGVEALAISFMHAYRNGVHEARAAAIVREMYPDLPVTLSSRVAPEIREFERTSTACANAYVQPLMRRYLDRLEERLAEMAFSGSLYVMLSGGGIASVQEAKDYPIRLIESGPAAGAMAAAFVSRLAGLDRVVSYDMGGTTAKMCLVEDGRPDHIFDFEAGRVQRFVKGSGLPLKVSVVDMIEIGAGGGSIARIDEGSGLMKVGPRSAGSNPGPVCYGLGGTRPTVTDADLLLGRLDPSYFLGGEITLDMDSMRAVFDRELGEKIGLDTTGSALGVQRIVDETMAAATRMHLAEKGRDPRNYTMIAFGGAGPVHAYNLARILKMKRLLVPLGAGVASALGFLVAPPATDMVRSYVGRLDELDWNHIQALFTEMAEDGLRLLIAAGAKPEEIELKPAAELRFLGQGFEVTTPLPSVKLTAADIPAIRSAFIEGYRQRFEQALDDGEIEAISWRLSCVAPGRDIHISDSQRKKGAATGEALRGERTAVFEQHGAVSCKVYDRYLLKPGDRFDGPALIEERESTCCIGPGSKAVVDAYLNLVIELPEEV